jgi:hypothetical protein
MRADTKMLRHAMRGARRGSMRCRPPGRMARAHARCVRVARQTNRKRIEGMACGPHTLGLRPRRLGRAPDSCTSLLPHTYQHIHPAEHTSHGGSQGAPRQPALPVGSAPGASGLRCCFLAAAAPAAASGTSATGVLIHQDRTQRPAPLQAAHAVRCCLQGCWAVNTSSNAYSTPQSHMPTTARPAKAPRAGAPHSSTARRILNA